MLATTGWNPMPCEAPLATMAEADREYAYALGSERPDVEWILSDRDAWYRNPFYRGPRTPHPEDVFEDEADYDSLVLALNFTGPRQVEPLLLDEPEDLPF